MKKLVLLLLVVLTTVVAQAASKVAIYVDGPISEGDKFIIESRVSDALKNNGLIIFERSEEFKSFLTKEHSYQLSGEVAQNQICQLAKKGGANYVIGIRVVETRGTMFATAAIMNVTTGKDVSKISNHKEIKNVDDLIVFAATLGANISREARRLP